MRQYREANPLERRRRFRLENQPISDEEAAVFRQLKTWIGCGASLSAACSLTDVRESRLAGMVQELRVGRNSEFKSELEAILKVPWHFEGGCDDRPQFYNPAHGTDWLGHRWAD